MLALWQKEKGVRGQITDPTTKAERRALGCRKISETLLDFARPLLDDLPPDVTPERMHEALKVAVTAWNAVVLTAWEGERDWITETRASLLAQRGTGRDAALRIFDALVRRKRKRRFAGDLRAVSDVHVRWAEDGEELRVAAVARLPEKLRRAP